MGKGKSLGSHVLTYNETECKQVEKWGWMSETMIPKETEWHRNIKPGLKTEIGLKSSVLLDAWVNLGMCREKCKDAGHFPLVEASWVCRKPSGWVIYPAGSASKPAPSCHPHQHRNPAGEGTARPSVQETAAGAAFPWPGHSRDVPAGPREPPGAAAPTTKVS